MAEHKIKWSHSSLKDYEGCARRYHEVKVLRKYPFQETDATRYGTEYGGKVLRFTDIKADMVDLSGGALHDTKM